MCATGSDEQWIASQPLIEIDCFATTMEPISTIVPKEVDVEDCENSRAPPALPQELIDNIIDHLHDDPLTLKSCSLVCKSWMPSATYHLFQEVKWPPCTRKDTDEPCPAHCAGSMALYYLMLELRVWNRLQMAQTRHFTLSWHTENCTDNSGRGTGTVGSADVLSEILDQFHCLRTLTIQQAQLDPAQTPEGYQPGHRPSEVLALWRDGRRLEHGVDLQATLEFLASFRNIEFLSVYFDDTLALNDSMPDAPPHDQAPALESRVAIKNLVVNNAFTLMRLSTLVDFRSITVLCLTGYDSKDLFVRFLREMTNLKSLTYTAYGEDWPEQLPVLHLESLAVRDVFPFINKEPENWPNIVRDVGRLANNGITELCIVMDFDEEKPDRAPLAVERLGTKRDLERYLEKIDWDQLGSVVDRYTASLNIVGLGIMWTGPMAAYLPEFMDVVEEVAMRRSPRCVRDRLQVYEVEFCSKL